MNISRKALLTITLTAASATLGLATPTYTDMTVWDGNNGPSVGWYNRGTGAGFAVEDNETEANPTTWNGQQWDLEGLSYFASGPVSDRHLSVAIVGGVDMIAGEIKPYHDATYQNYSGPQFEAPGDIFINRDGSVYTPGNIVGQTATTIGNIGGWEYALRLNITGAGLGSYTVYSLTSASVFSKVTDVPSSNAFKLLNSAGNFGTVGTYTLEYFKGVPTADLAIGGTKEEYNIQAQGSGVDYYPINSAPNMEDLHNITVLDMTWLRTLVPVNNPTFHLTIACGNDNLAAVIPFGWDRVPDGSYTLILLGISFFGVAVTRRYSVK